MIDWSKEAATSHAKTEYKNGGIVLSPWLMEWMIDKCDREIHKIVKAAERVNDGDYGFLQQELIYCAHELMTLHGYVLYQQISNNFKKPR